MKRFGWQCLAASSLLLASLAAMAETRPLYGGMLHISVHEAPMSVDPADTTQPDSFARRNITALIFETLITTDDSGRVRPALATEWTRTETGGTQLWRLGLRKGVMFHDGTALTPAIAAASLRVANPSWKITFDAESVTIEFDIASHPHLLEELALQRNAIVRRSDDGKLNGTGPFQISEWQAGKKLSLAAEENYWGGRPFLDAIEIEFGKSFHEQLISQELGKSDLIEISAEQSHRISPARHQLASSPPIELVGLVFARDAQTAEDNSLREALALCIDRASMSSVILQGAGQPAAAILPNWMSGYAFVFPTTTDLARARHLHDEMRTPTRWTISYDASDQLAGLLAERIALNAKDAGLQLQPTKAATADLRIAEIPLPTDPVVALGAVAGSVGLPRSPMSGDSAEDLYAAERALLATRRLIPLFHLPVAYAAGPYLRDWNSRPDGIWSLASAWLARDKTGSSQP